MATVFFAIFNDKPLGIYSTYEKAKLDIGKAFLDTFRRRNKEIKDGHYIKWRSYRDEKTNLLRAYGDEFINNKSFCFGVGLGKVEEVIIDEYQFVWQF